MGPVAMYTLAALLACLHFSVAGLSLSPIPVDIPNGKVHVYKYSAVVSAGQNEPTPFASKFQIEGKFLYKKINGDPDAKFAQYMKFQDIKHAIYNGPNDGEVHGQYQTLQTVVKDFEEPFLVAYNDSNKVYGIKMQEKEATWSKNMKKSVASIMQIDLRRFWPDESVPITAPPVEEKTIHGDCQVDYNVHIEEKNGKSVYYVRKTYEPRKCSAYVQHIVSEAKSMDCKVEAEEDLVTSTERIYEIEYLNNELVIKKIVSHEKMSYLPWLHRSAGIQYIETKQTFEFEKVVDESELKLPVVELSSVPLMSNLTFDKLDYAIHENPEKENHFGRHTMKSSDLIAEVKELLLTVVDYLKVNPIVKEADPKYVNVLEKLHQTMGNLNSESMHYLFDHFNMASGKGNMSRNIFLEMIPHTGTYAAWNFTKNIIKDGEIEEETALGMLANLPMYILNPTEKLAEDMIEFTQFDDSTSKAIKTAGVLTYSILLHKTYKSFGKNVPPFLKEQLDNFYERIINEPTYQSKIVYIMALRNIEVGGIYEYLAPIVRGKDVFFVKVDIDKPEKYRIAAMWAVAKSISHDRQLTYNLFWPILSNSSNPLSLRVTAYELLIPRNPMLDMNLLMNVYWMMMQEKDDHMFNYHYTTMKSMAETTDPCTKNVAEMMRKVLRLTKKRKLVSSALSRVKVFDYYDEKYGHGRTFKIGAEVDEASGIAQVGYYEVVPSFGRRPRLASGLYWNVEGVNTKTITTLFNELLKQKAGIVRDTASYEVDNMDVKNLLRQTYGYKLLEKQIRLEFWSMSKGYVTNVNVYFENQISELLRNYAGKVKNLLDAGEIFNRNLLDISFLNHYKMVVATDLGIPATFYNEVPELSYLKLKLNTYPFKSMVTTKLEFETRFHHRSFYKMEFYNPFIDVTQAVQRRVTTDATLPIDMTVSFNLEMRSLKIFLPRMPESRFSVAGVKIQSVDQVEIGNDHAKLLKVFCSHCEHVADITKGPMHKNNYESISHSMDTGLEYSSSIFDCENSHIASTEREEWFRVFNTVMNDPNDDPWPKYMLVMTQRLFNLMNAPHRGTCSTMLKIAPCTVYPTSHIEMNWRLLMQKSGDTVDWNVRGFIDSRAASTNNTMRFWDVDLKLKTSQFINDVEVQFMRHSSGEKDVKICLTARKEYPNFIANAEALKHETTTKIEFTMDQSDGEHCSTDGTQIKALIKGELLDEQKRQMESNVKEGSCFKNPSNPLDLDIAQRFDWNCLYQAVQATTLRKYSVDVTYEKVPHEILASLAELDDYLRLDNIPHITYKPDHAEPGHVKIFFTYSLNNNYGNITIMNPFYSYELEDILYGPEDEEDRHNDLVLDNTVFSNSFLVDYYKGEIRPCIVHANDMINDLNQTIPVDLKDWTLMSGDYALMSYAVFVKAVQDNKVAMRIYANAHVLDVHPGTSKPIVTLDGQVINNYEKGMLVPSDEVSYFRLMMVNQLLLIETEKFFTVKVYYTPYNVIILPHIVLDRAIDGMCGHMGSTSYPQQVPLVYGSA